MNNPASDWRARVNRITNDPQRIAKRKELLAQTQSCPDNCACQTEDAYTTQLDLEDVE